MTSKLGVNNQGETDFGAPALTSVVSRISQYYDVIPPAHHVGVDLSNKPRWRQLSLLHDIWRRETSRPFNGSQSEPSSNSAIWCTFRTILDWNPVEGMARTIWLFRHSRERQGHQGQTAKEGSSSSPSWTNNPKVFKGLSDTGDDFDTAAAKFDAHFSPNKNIRYERHRFKQARQQQGESID